MARFPTPYFLSRQAPEGEWERHAKWGQLIVSGHRQRLAARSAELCSEAADSCGPRDVLGALGASLSRDHARERAPQQDHERESDHEGEALHRGRIVDPRNEPGDGPIFVRWKSPWPGPARIRAQLDSLLVS